MKKKGEGKLIHFKRGGCDVIKSLIRKMLMEDYNYRPSASDILNEPTVMEFDYEFTQHQAEKKPNKDQFFQRSTLKQIREIVMPDEIILDRELSTEQSMFTYEVARLNECVKQQDLILDWRGDATEGIVDKLHLVNYVGINMP